MKQFLLIAGALAVAASVSAQPGVLQLPAANVTEIPACKMTEATGVDVHMLTQAEINDSRRRAAATPVAWYKRPAGAYWATSFTRIDDVGYFSWYCPYVFGFPYKPTTYVNTSTGASSVKWDLYSEWSSWIHPTTDSVPVTYTLEVDTLPVLTASNADTSVIFQPKGYNGDKAYVGCVTTYPNYPTYIDTVAEREAWVNSHFFGSSSNRTGTVKVGAHYATVTDSTGKAAGKLLGKNTAGWNCVAAGFEAPEHPYALRKAGIRFQMMKLAKASSTPVFTATVYKVDSLPSYKATSYNVVDLSKATVIGKASYKASESSMINSFSYNSSTDEFVGLMPFDLEAANGGVPLNIDFPIIVVVEGYNVDDVSDFTTIYSADTYDEGYGELAYVGVKQGDNAPTLIGLHNSFFGASNYTGIGINLEIEHPFFEFNLKNYPGNHEFDPDGEDYRVELFSYRRAGKWKVSGLPSWLNVQLVDSLIDNEYFTYVVTANFTAAPNKGAYRDAVVRFTYPGAEVDFTASQGPSTAGVDKVAMSGVAARVEGGNIVVEASQAAQASVYNVAGQLVRQAALSEGSNVIDGQSLARGVYLVKVGSKTVKIVK